MSRLKPWEDAREWGRVKRIEAKNVRLESKVRRLTRAGNAMHKFLIAYIVDNRVSSAYLNKLDDGWLNAKQGGQP